MGGCPSFDELTPAEIDGTCHIANKPALGSAKSAMTRIFDRLGPFSSYYSNTGRRKRNWSDEIPGLDICRERSVALREMPLSANLKRGLKESSTLLFFWTQFLDHDIMSNEPLSDKCDCQSTDHRCLKIAVKAGTNNQPCIPLSETMFCRDTQNPFKKNWPVPANAITAWVDGSNIYGSSNEEANKLKDGGKLKVSKSNDFDFNTGGGFLQSDGTEKNCFNGKNCSRCTLAGDNRSSENPGLTLAHLTYVKLHNFLYDLLKETNNGGELDFYLIKRVVTCTWGSHVFEEINPAMFGDTLNDLLIKNYRGNDEVVLPMSLGLHTGLARLHHLIPKEIPKCSGGNVDMAKSIQNFESFNCGTGPFLQRLLNENLTTYRDDKLVTESMGTDLTFDRKVELDLFAINCARTKLASDQNFGKYRDRALEGYNKLGYNLYETNGRNDCHGSSLWNLDDLDVFTGSRCEAQGSEGVLPPTTAWHVGEIMRANKKSRHFYEKLGHNHPIRELTKPVHFHGKGWCSNIKWGG